MSRGTVIAIVDDDFSVRAALRRLLESGGFEVETFSTVREFLDESEWEKRRIGCAIFDVRMPDDGLELQATLLKSDPRLPVLVVTACQEEGTERRARTQGAFAFLPKPVESEALFRTVRRALRASRLDQNAEEGTDDGGGFG